MEPSAAYQQYTALRLSCRARRARQPCAAYWQYAALRLLWLWADTSFLRRLAKRIARVSGLPANKVGGHSFLIGGATDMAGYGYGVSPTMLKTRSRWPSDIVYIYACVCDTIAQHFHAADAIYAASGEPLESAFADWVQPARR